MAPLAYIHNPSTGSICRPNKRIQRRCDPLTSLKQESLVAFHFQQRCLNRDALCRERWLAKLVHQRWAGKLPGPYR